MSYMVRQDRTKPIRFIIAGVLNTVFGFLTFSCAIMVGSSVWAAILLGMILGTVFNFVTTGGYVFRDLSVRRAPRFIAVYLLTFVANLTLIGYVSTLLSDAILAQAILTPPIALLSYYLMNRFVFLKKRRS